ncbi:hypothetical protein J7J60_02535 [bacterium]|nr:hypothetical protein [bacterium]
MVNSETLNPVEKRSSKIALSLNLVNSFCSTFKGAFKKFSKSSPSKKLISLSLNFGSSIFSGAKDFISCLARYFKKALIEIK